MSALTSSAAALAALEPYLLLAKSARGAGAAKLIEQATSAPGCYVFGELLDVEGIKQLASSSEHASSYHLLELFAYGTYPDYLSASTPGSGSPPLPALTEAQRAKLQRLTLVTMAGQARVLDYGSLALALGLTSSSVQSGHGQPSAGPSSSSAVVLSEAIVRELEDIIIEAIYAGVLGGKLNQKLRRFEVEAALGRDVRGAQELGNIANSLQAWSSSAEAVLNQLSQRIVDARSTARRATEQKTAHEAEITRVLYQLYDNALGSRRVADRPPGNRAAGTGEDGDAMDVDADGTAAEGGSMLSPTQGRSRKKGLGSASLARHKRSRA
ncbi:hypothetical protein A4X13_0g3309 [Tilletia indica]|uniref:Uncharacterized protein n=1 Tax=Tilletia indica TaxID=43049 RepID=A0A177TAR2_9BASI|nr:hypothetical protein A4X13_0g3309 [Tilletia indica]